MIRNQTRILNETAQALWSAYREARTEDNRNALAVHFQPFVEWLAQKTFDRLSYPQFEAADLANYGAIALLDLIERFDGARGVEFTAFAAKRLSGSMLDGIRQMDWVPRNVRIKAKKGECTAKHMKSLEEEHWSERDDGGRADWFSGTIRSMLKLKGTSESEQQMHAQDFWDGMLKGFNPQERNVLTLYYRDHLTMKEVGRRIGLSESRVSQMHTSIVERLQAKYPKNDGRWN